ncbi:lysophospholipid acyltransferase family protein [Candidatus Zixiibacteriota bacterium]
MSKRKNTEKGTVVQELHSRIIWIAAAGVSVIIAALTILLLLTPDGRMRSAKLIQRWAGLLLKLASVKTRAIGLEKLPDEGPTIFIANHQSILDIPVVITTLPIGLCMFAKRSLFKIPIFGWAMSAQGFVPVVRHDRSKARQSLQPAERILREGRQLFIFPEGTRSRTGELGTFKTGAFRLGISTETPIVPLTLIGGDSILPPRRRLIKRGRITMVVGEAIDTAGLDLSDRHELRDRTWNWMAETKKHYSEEEEG